MRLLYNTGILFYLAAAKIAAPFNVKARLWNRGRENWAENLKSRVGDGDKIIWFHCASLGEFEQGRPVIEKLKKEKPDFRILLTFFSPSGYEVRKNYGNADIICYLPADTPRNAEKFISLVNPVMVFFIKYEFWNNYITLLSRRGVPLYLISGIFRKEQPFFKWYGGFFRKMLSCFTRIYVQDKESEELLKGNGIEEVIVTGDTRFDRVAEIAASAREIPLIEQFRGTEKVVLAGSSWHQDEEIIARYINKDPGRLKWIFAPHETDPANIDRLEKLFKTETVRFSGLSGETSGARVLIIDNVGMLSSAYRYAYFAAIGGGFGKGIHNILEAACWGIPVVFGPNFGKFREAVDLISLGAARTFSDYEEFSVIADRWLTDLESYGSSAQTAAEYIKRNTGATDIILNCIREKDINIDRSKLVENYPPPDKIGSAAEM